MSFFSGKRILGHCDADLFFMWWLFHTLDDSLSDGHPFRSDRELLGPWFALINALDDSFSRSFCCQGSVSDFVTIFLGDYYEP